MNNELTQVDIDKMKEELKYRIEVLRPEIMEEVKLTRSYGDLGENAEYKAAKQTRGKNESRIRYLTNMIKTAVIIEASSNENEVGLFDTVEFTYDDGETDCVRIVTMLRQDALQNIISKDSPLGKALMGKKVGQTATVQLENGDGSYEITVKSITKGVDDDTLSIRKY